MNIIFTKDPEKLALTLNGQSYSYRELKKLIDEMSEKLRKLPQGIIALSANQSIEFITQALAAIKNEQAIIVLSQGLSVEEQEKQLNTIKNVLIICDKGRLLDIKDNPTGHDCHSQTAVILFTSGSVTQPKAVQLSYANIQANIHAIIKALDFTSVTDQLLFLPLCYSYGLFGQLFPALSLGVHTYLTDFTSTANVLMSGKIPQMWSGVPSHWLVLSQLFAHFPQAEEKISHIISAGDKLSLSQRHILHEQFTNAVIYNNYGLTEASPRVLTLKSTDERFFSDAVGYPIGDWLITLSENNELLIKGSQMMLGYLGEQDPHAIKDGWLHTGDVAEINENQLVSIKGRIDNTININGEKINLTYIEQLLKAFINDVVVLSQDDKLQGQRLVIVVEKSTEYSLKQLREIISKNMPHWQHGFELRKVDSFPKNSRGKLDRKKLKTIILSGTQND